MTRREELEAEIVKLDRSFRAEIAAANAANDRADSLLRQKHDAMDQLAALPPDPPPFRVSDAVRGKASVVAGIFGTSPNRDAALIQAWVEEQFPGANVATVSVNYIRAKAGLT